MDSGGLLAQPEPGSSPVQVPGKAVAAVYSRTRAIRAIGWLRWRFRATVFPVDEQPRAVAVQGGVNSSLRLSDRRA